MSIVTIKASNIAKHIKSLCISGDFTKDTTPQLQKVCNEISSEKNLKGIILDFKGVTKIDSAAFACMIDFMKQHMSKNLKISLINTKKQENAFMEILKIESFIKSFNSESKAVAYLSK